MVAWSGGPLLEVRYLLFDHQEEADLLATQTRELAETAA